MSARPHRTFQALFEQRSPPLRDLGLEHLEEVRRRRLGQLALAAVVLAEGVEVRVEGAELVDVVVRVGVVRGGGGDGGDVVRQVAAAAEYITVVGQVDRVLVLFRFTL